MQRVCDCGNPATRVYSGREWECDRCRELRLRMYEAPNLRKIQRGK